MYCKSLLLGLLLLLGRFAGNHATERDISCLKSIKDSLEDPLGNLRSWKFNNNNSDGFICSFKGIDCWHLDENKVVNIQLSNMGLKGEFPQGVADCKGLTGLNLSNNYLYGNIPSDVSTLLSYITTLDLSSNDFDGEIPTTLANCTYLNVLKLDNNWLTGEIPSEIGKLPRLKEFSFANNDGVCGAPLEPCTHQHFLRSFISGFLEGWAIFTVLGVVISYFCMRTTKKKQAMANSLTDISMEDYQIAMLEKITSKMSLAELSQATYNFAETSLLGIGRMGETYKATLPNGCFLAIKKLHGSDSQQFMTELLTLGRIRNMNFVPLIGFYWEMNTKLLVYNFMPNGNLHACLQSRILEWPRRLKIAVGIARGLSWLHHNNMAHLGLTTKCILLDQDFEPRLSNFGQAKFVNPIIESSLWKNLVNINSEVPESGCYEKDVHDLGTLLLELIQQRDSSDFANDDDEIFKFVEVVKKCLVYDPDERPSALEVYLTLRSILEGSEMNSNHIDDASEIAAWEITEICVADDRI